MKLLEIKKIFLKNEITGVKLYHLLKDHIDKLKKLFPKVDNLMSMGYLYINDLPQSVSYCDRSKRNRRLVSMKDGFLEYCGNQGSCICNNENIKSCYLNRSEKDKNVINEKRAKTNINKYGIDFASKTQDVKDKAANTCIERYGALSPTQSPTVISKLNKTMQSNWGVDWPHQNKELAKRAEQTWLKTRGVSRPAKDPSVLNKMKNTMIKLYGVDHNMKHADIVARARYSNRIKKYDDIMLARPSATPLFTKEEFATNTSDFDWNWICNKCKTEFNQKLLPGHDVRCMICYPISESLGETEIRNWLETNNINFIQNDRTCIKPYELDFYVPSLKIAIEYNGIYWHSERILDDRRYHFNKFKLTHDNDIKLIQIWEHDLCHKKEIILSRLSHIFKLSSIKIGARSCIIKDISASVARDFLNLNHLQGFRPSKYYFGAYYKDELVACMTIGKNRFNKNADYELIRYATSLSISVQGGLSKFLSYVSAKLGNITLLTYADLCWGKGGGYEKLGFDFQHYSDPNYFYFKSINDVRSRTAFQKHKIIGLAEGNSEKEIAYNMGYNRFFDAGNSVWIKRL